MELFLKESTTLAIQNEPETCGLQVEKLDSLMPIFLPKTFHLINFKVSK